MIPKVLPLLLRFRRKDSAKHQVTGTLLVAIASFVGARNTYQSDSVSGENAYSSSVIIFGPTYSSDSIKA